MSSIMWLWYGLKVAAVGILVVFVGLIILIGCIKVLGLTRGRDKAAPAAAPQASLAPQIPQAQPARTYTPGPLLTRQDDAFYAVITAAVARVLADEGVNPEGGFAIRAVKPIDAPTPGPALAPGDGALYAVLTGAIARVLADEGINPEGGFAIKSVKAL